MNFLEATAVANQENVEKLARLPFGYVMFKRKSQRKAFYQKDSGVSSPLTLQKSRLYDFMKSPAKKDYSR